MAKKRTKKKAVEIELIEKVEDVSLPPIEIQLDSVPMAPVDKTEIARRAFQRFLARGGSHGHAFEDWLAAEAELRGEVTPVTDIRG
jgi:hypothetical protein